MRKKNNTPWSEKTRGVIDELKGGAKEEAPSPKVSVSWAWPGTWMEWFEEVPHHIYEPEKQFVGFPGIPKTNSSKPIQGSKKQEWESHEDYMRRRREEVEKLRTVEKQQKSEEKQRLYGDEIWRAEIGRLETKVDNIREELARIYDIVKDIRK